MTDITQQTDKRKRTFMAISTQGIIMILVAAAMMSLGSLGLKGSIEAIGGFAENLSTIHKDVIALLLNPIFIIGLILYGGGTLVWMRVLSTEPISVGYPILMGSAFIAITIGAAIFFNETITLPRIIGMLIIVTGVIVASQG